MYNERNSRHNSTGNNPHFIISSIGPILRCPLKRVIFEPSSYMPVTWNRHIIEFNVNVIVVIEKNDGVNDYKHNEARLEIFKKYYQFGKSGSDFDRIRLYQIEKLI